jgi:hypothetical protein
MINPSPIDLHAAAHCARLIFESMDTSVLAKQDRSHVDPLAHSSPDQNTPFLSLNPLLARLHFSQTFVANTRGSSLTSNPLYNLRRKR